LSPNKKDPILPVGGTFFEVPPIGLTDVPFMLAVVNIWPLKNNFLQTLEKSLFGAISNLKGGMAPSLDEKCVRQLRHVLVPPGLNGWKRPEDKVISLVEVEIKLQPQKSTNYCSLIVRFKKGRLVLAMSIHLPHL
jgi:hypothetical protein